jgi:hypothetical protein
MGARGTAVFSDDTACDVRDGYVDLLGDGVSGSDATKRLLREWAESLKDPDEAPVFWLALAATQWRYGRLEEHVLQQALSAIDDGSDLSRWHAAPQDYRKRLAVLDKLRAQLTSSQPPERRVRKRFRGSNDWKTGELIGYRLLSGRFVVLRVIGHNTDKGGTSPICELLDWIGDSLPNESQLKTVSIRKSNEARPTTQYMIGATTATERPDDRLQRLEIISKPSQLRGQFTVTHWRLFDHTLKERFGIS